MIQVKSVNVAAAGFMGLMLMASILSMLRPGSAFAKQTLRAEAKANNGGGSESPFVCNTGVYTAAVRKHKDDLNNQFVALVQGYQELPDGYAFRFAADAKSFQTVAEWAELERYCCPFFCLSLELEREGGPLWLRLTGREGVKALIRSEFHRVMKKLAAPAGTN
jgi:hypothetical protein